MSVFDIIGPIMIGPSSSHTAGAVRSGLLARKLLGTTPKKAEICLYGSFAKTYKGHYTDKALIGGILGFLPDDVRLKESFDYAKRENLEVVFTFGINEYFHPNTATIKLFGKDKKVSVTISSIGGGQIKVIDINDIPVSF
ncbi:MAG: serine dehydratase beta chain [Oscillospiraceae bacterium]